MGGIRDESVLFFCAYESDCELLRGRYFHHLAVEQSVDTNPLKLNSSNRRNEKNENSKYLRNKVFVLEQRAEGWEIRAHASERWYYLFI